MLLDTYSPIDGRYDELGAADGRLRPHWEYLVQALSTLDKRQLAERQWELNRLLVEHGVFYNIYGAESPRTRPWALDLLPLVITSREWREIEVGLVQRAELLRLIIHDVYGEQRLLRRGLIPAELIHAHPGFMLPCCKMGLPLAHSLILYAADLGRSPDGRVWVNGDRTQAPSGIGYALAARTVTSRVLPSIFRESNVHPVLPFLRALRSALLDLAQDELDQIAVLTAGPANETWSEQAYLARQLGLPLIEGADLQVAHGSCWMLGADERQPISVLLRRLDDDYCDPLELNRRSLLGTPGLVQAARNRRLLFANPLGTSLLENPALMAFLPRLCRELLGEELKLPSRDSWWCGRENDLWYVRRHFDDMIIRRFRPDQSQPPIAVAELGMDARAELLARIQDEPQAWVAQTAIAQSCAPVYTREGIHAHALELRTFAVTSGDSFRVMSGGLARSGQSRDSWRFSSQLGGVSKDVWVLASEAQREAHTLPQFLPRLQRQHQLTQPHVAENLLWIGRYAQRCEILSRMLRKSGELVGDYLEPEPAAQALLQALTWQSTVYPGFVGPLGEPALKAPIPGLIELCCGPMPGTLKVELGALVTMVNPVRDMLPVEALRLLDRIATLFDNRADWTALRESVDQAAILTAALNGLLLRSLQEGSARSLIELGFAIELAIGHTRLLRSLLVGPLAAHADVPALLHELVGGSGADVEEDGDMRAALLRGTLLADASPQSVRYQLMSAERLLRSLQLPTRRADRSTVEARISSKLSELGSLDLRELLGTDNAGLDRHLRELGEWLSTTATMIERRYSPRRAAPASQLVLTA